MTLRNPKLVIPAKAGIQVDLRSEGTKADGFPLARE
jgi:hypothetical protein